MIQKLLSHSSLALFVAVTPLIAQEASESTTFAVSQESGESSTYVESTFVEASAEPEVSSFFFPGGYGYLPETISPGTGTYARPPVDFSLTLQTGYNDNIYSSSGKEGASPRKGSPTVQGSGGVNLLLNNPRTFVSLGANVGAVYYTEKERNALSPVGSMTAALAHSFSPRVQLTSRVNAGYYSQPNLSLPNAPTANSGDYFNLGSLFNLSYRWTPLFTTDTSFGANTQIFRDSQSEDSNYVELFVGESFRYLFAPRFTGVAEVRFSSFNYNGSNRNSTTESVMAGFDWQMSSRLTSTFRGGASFRQFDIAGSEDRVSPYVESAVGYRYGRGSLLQWTTRYGFEEAHDAFSSNQTFRTGLMVSQVLTPRINASLGLNYAYERYERLADEFNHDNFTRDQHLFTGSTRLEFIATRSLTLFGSYSYTRNISDTEFNEYYRNEVSVGATIHF